MTLRINQRRTTVKEYLDRLSQLGISAGTASDEALELVRLCRVEKLPGFAQGLVSVQDTGAQLVTKLLERIG